MLLLETLVLSVIAVIPPQICSVSFEFDVPLHVLHLMAGSPWLSDYCDHFESRCLLLYQAAEVCPCTAVSFRVVCL